LKQQIQTIVHQKVFCHVTTHERVKLAPWSPSIPLLESAEILEVLESARTLLHCLLHRCAEESEDGGLGGKEMSKKKMDGHEEINSGVFREHS